MVAVAGGTVFAVDTTTIAAKTTGRLVCKLVQQVAGQQTALTTATDIVLTFGASSEEIDTHNAHDTTTNNSRITPTVAGIYRVDIKPILAFSTTITSIGTALRKNGTVVERTGNHKPNATANVNIGAPQFSTMIAMNGTTDYLEAVVFFVASANQATNNVAGSTCTFTVTYERD